MSSPTDDLVTRARLALLRTSARNGARTTLTRDRVATALNAGRTPAHKDVRWLERAPRTEAANG